MAANEINAAFRTVQEELAKARVENGRLAAALTIHVYGHEYLCRCMFCDLKRQAQNGSALRELLGPTVELLRKNRKIFYDRGLPGACVEIDTELARLCAVMEK